MYTLVLLRHGQSTFNKEKIFCGWTDAPLTEKGKEEAKKAGESLKKANHDFDVAFSSVLDRAIDTLHIALHEMGIKEKTHVNYSWKLNERHYGWLQGQKHEDISKAHSAEQVQVWRRSYSVKPPQLEDNDPRHPKHDPKYKDLDHSVLPKGESLEDTINRVLPHWHDEIVPQIKQGKKVIIAASGNSLRALIKYIDGISDDNIVGLEILNGTPLVYHLDQDLKPIEKYYLVDGERKPLTQS